MNCRAIAIFKAGIVALFGAALVSYGVYYWLSLSPNVNSPVSASSIALEYGSVVFLIILICYGYSLISECDKNVLL
jgi:uncharacterized membrane protein YdcZ (DUF606 family)